MGFLQRLFGRKLGRAVLPREAVSKTPQNLVTLLVQDDLSLPAQAPAVDPKAGVRDRYRNLSPAEAYKAEHRARFYDKERERAAAAGKSVKQLRAGLLGTEDTKAALAKLKVTGEQTPKFRMRGCGKGLAVALPDGRVIDPTSVYLRPWHIYGAKIMGTGHYKAGAAQRRDGQQLSLKREPKNEHDPNAVAVMTRSGSAKIGYVAKGQAKHVAKALDSGMELVAHTVLEGNGVLITTPAMWSTMNSR